MPAQSNSSPHIEIRLAPGPASIAQSRPAVLSQLAGMEVEKALELVPRLLPICGAAQSIAAVRAVEAARDIEPGWATEVRRERDLAREQALSCGWRLAVDWPDLLGEPRDMDWLKQLRGSEDSAEVSSLLHQALPGLTEVRTPADLSSWTDQEHCNAARVLAATIAAVGGGNCHLYTGSKLEYAARISLSSADHDPLAPAPQPVEVGPLAMGRDELVQQLAVQRVYGAPARRTAALLLDTRHIDQQLQRDPEPQPSAWREDERCGCGMATTARGPVFHRVELDDSERISRWQAVAPTDWHFAENGPVAAALPACTDVHQARLLAAGFDPCVPCQVRDGAAG